MKERKLIFSTTIKDCEVQTFRAGGPGGQNQNKRNSGVRVIHHPSGARGESRESRSQLENKRIAFQHMAVTKEFYAWARTKALMMRPIGGIIEEQMNEGNLLVEKMENGRWIKWD